MKVLTVDNNFYLYVLQYCENSGLFLTVLDISVSHVNTLTILYTGVQTALWYPLMLS